jgi:hydrogenase maturation protein HypF
LAQSVDAAAWEAVGDLAQSGLNSPLTTSVGRLFDAVAALCGVRARVEYEGQAAAELEGASDPGAREGYPLPLATRAEAGDGAGDVVLDARETVLAVAEDAARGAATSVIGGRFHEALARATAAALIEEAERAHTDLVVLSGGVFQNRLLLERTVSLLRGAALRVLVPLRLPPNDGGIAYGQVAVAAARLRDGMAAAGTA